MGFCVCFVDVLKSVGRNSDPWWKTDTKTNLLQSHILDAHPWRLRFRSYIHHHGILSTAPPSEPCDIQCLNGGSCFLNARQVAKCRCQPSYMGDRCEINQCRDYCKNGGTCTASHAGKDTTGSKGVAHFNVFLRPSST